MQIKLNDLDTRLARIERVMANQSLLEVANQLEALRSDVRAMHNDVDQLSKAWKRAASSSAICMRTSISA